MQALASSLSDARKGDYKSCSATLEEIEAAFTGRCRVCGVPEAECNTRLNMDHSHETGDFRGWLCKRCNFAAGYLRDSPDIALRLAEYLEGHTAPVR